MLGPLLAELRILVCVLENFYMEMSFLDSIGHIMTETGLKVLFSVVYAENTVPHMLNGKVIARAIRAHILVDCSRYI